MNDLKERLSHVLWIGGGTDAGKTSIADVLARRYRLPAYHYDRTDLAHHQRLAATSPDYAAFLTASLDDRWVRASPETLALRASRTFNDRFPLVVEDLTALNFPEDMRVIAEGFGLSPELVAPCLGDPRRAVWLTPTDAFKQASMERRNKGKFGGEVSDPVTAARNLFERDRLLAHAIVDGARRNGFHLIEVDGSQTIDAMAARIADWFGLP